MLGDNYRTALEMRSQFGDDAVNVAAARAYTCEGEGDRDGFDNWNRVCAMLEHLAHCVGTQKRTRMADGKGSRAERSAIPVKTL